MLEHCLDKIVEEADKKAFTHKEIFGDKESIKLCDKLGVIGCYWWYMDYTIRHSKKPSNHDITKTIAYMANRFSEPYNFSIMRIQRITDIWHENKPLEKQVTDYRENQE